MPSALVGFLLTYLPNAIGASLLASAGEVNRVGREPIVWMATGAASGLLLAIVFGGSSDSGIWTFATVSTSTVCAALCRAQTRWED